MATLTYNYADSTVVLGPLSRRAEPHTYDLCRRHTESMTAPKGWELLRLQLPAGEYRRPEPDDLLAVAHAVQSPLQSRTHGQGENQQDQQNQQDHQHDDAASSRAATSERADRSSTTPRADRSDRAERPEPIGVDGPARPGRPPLRLLKDPEA